MAKVGAGAVGKGKTDGGEGRSSAGRPRYDISIFPSWCKDCGICAEFCRKKVFDRDMLGTPVISRPEDCNGCQECVLHCPDFAIQVVRKKKSPAE